MTILECTVSGVSYIHTAGHLASWLTLELSALQNWSSNKVECEKWPSGLSSELLTHECPYMNIHMLSSLSTEVHLAGEVGFSDFLWGPAFTTLPYSEAHRGIGTTTLKDIKAAPFRPETLGWGPTRDLNVFFCFLREMHNRSWNYYLAGIHHLTPRGAHYLLTSMCYSLI